MDFGGHVDSVARSIEAQSIADKAGMICSDFIVKIGTVEVDGLPYEKVVDMLRVGCGCHGCDTTAVRAGTLDSRRSHQRPCVRAESHHSCEGAQRAAAPEVPLHAGSWPHCVGEPDKVVV